MDVLGQFHPQIVHTPIVLLIFSALFAIAGRLFDRDWVRKASVLLLVFGFLVIPAVAGLMATARTGPALAIGWVFGFTASVMGLLASVKWDMPAAPSILVMLTAMLVVHGVLVMVWKRVRGRSRRTAQTA